MRHRASPEPTRPRNCVPMTFTTENPPARASSPQGSSTNGNFLFRLNCPRTAWAQAEPPRTAVLATDGDAELNVTAPSVPLLSERNDMNKEMTRIQDEVRVVSNKIEKAEVNIRAVEDALEQQKSFLGMSDPKMLLDERKSLRDEKKQLQDEKKLLLEEKQRLTMSGSPSSISKALMAFSNSLTRATLTKDVLQLPDGVSFLGDETLGQKIYVREHYRDIKDIIFEGANANTKRNTVVTGSPGIGKSLFNFYLLYLLRLEGKTVVFNLKEEWYRLSDEGVEMEDSRSKLPTRYFKDPNSWFLCDPTDKPYERFHGITVVTVAPNAERTEEFIKQAKSERLFMGPWNIEELEACRAQIYPWITSQSLQRGFDEVGGVARALFDEERLRDLIVDISKRIRFLSLMDFQRIMLMHIDSPIWEVSDKLVHMHPRELYREYVSLIASTDVGDEISDKSEDAIIQQEGMLLAGRSSNF